MEITRISRFQNSGKLSAKALNTEFDYVAAALQQMQAESARVIRLNPTDGEAALLLPVKEERSNKALVFDDQGNSDVCALPRQLSDISEDSRFRHFTAEQQTKLDGIEPAATADQTGAEIVAAINGELGSHGWQGSGVADNACAASHPGRRRQRSRRRNPRRRRIHGRRRQGEAERGDRRRDRFDACRARRRRPRAGRRSVGRRRHRHQELRRRGGGDQAGRYAGAGRQHRLERDDGAARSASEAGRRHRPCPAGRRHIRNGAGWRGGAALGTTLAVYADDPLIGSTDDVIEVYLGKRVTLPAYNAGKRDRIVVINAGNSIPSSKPIKPHRWCGALLSPTTARHRHLSAVICPVRAYEQCDCGKTMTFSAWVRAASDGAKSRCLFSIIDGTKYLRVITAGNYSGATVGLSRVAVLRWYSPGARRALSLDAACCIMSWLRSTSEHPLPLAKCAIGACRCAARGLDDAELPAPGRQHNGHSGAGIHDGPVDFGAHGCALGASPGTLPLVLFNAEPTTAIRSSMPERWGGSGG